MTTDTEALPLLPESTLIDNAQGRYWGFTADQMRAYARAALAQRQQVPQGWRPIQTAPRNGTNILLRFGVDGVSQGKYVVGGFHHPWRFIDTNDGITWMVNYAVDGPGGPSHWMHMPSAHLAPSLTAAPQAAEPCQWCCGTGRFADHACRFCAGEGEGSVFAAPQAAQAQPQPLKRGITGICTRSTCDCESNGLGLECVWLRPTDSEMERRTGEPHIDGWPLYSGLPPVQPQEPPRSAPLTEDQIGELVMLHAPPIHPDFTDDDFVGFVRAIERAHGISTPEEQR